jgi:predicted Holliday junction resolvase-like endonuclease
VLIPVILVLVESGKMMKEREREREVHNAPNNKDVH